MIKTPQEDYGIKIAKTNKDASSKDRKDLYFSSATATYFSVRVLTINVFYNPHVIYHGLNYVPKVIIKEILSDHDRKLPYDDGTDTKDFSVTDQFIKIRGVTSGTFKIYIFGQSVL